MKLPSRSPYLWIRDLHLYLGLFISPFVLLFSFTAILFNHTWKPWDTGSDAFGHKVSTSIELPQDVGGLEQARQIMSQLEISGEIRNIFQSDNRLEIPVMKPGREIRIGVDLKKEIAEVEQRDTGFWDTLFYLHKSPGPHNARIRGNWFFTRLWTWLADTVVYLILWIIMPKARY